MKIIANTMTVFALLYNKKHVFEEEVQITAVPAADTSSYVGISFAVNHGDYARSRSPE